MSLTKRIEYNQFIIYSDKKIGLRIETIIEEEGIEISRKFFRIVLDPYQDISEYPDKVRNLANFVWSKWDGE